MNYSPQFCTGYWYLEGDANLRKVHIKMNNCNRPVCGAAPRTDSYFVQVSATVDPDAIDCRHCRKIAPTLEIQG